MNFEQLCMYDICTHGYVYMIGHTLLYVCLGNYV